MKFYNFIKKSLVVITKCFLKVEVIGAEKIPQDIPVLLCSNHVSMWDPVLLLAYTRRQINFMGKAELFKVPVLSSILKVLGVFPVNRNGNDLRAIKTTISIIKQGNCVGIFPQGKRVMGEEPKDSDVKSGVGMCVYHAKCSVMPAAVVTKNNKVSLFKKVYVVYGEPISYKDFSMPEGIKEEFEQSSKLIFDKICELFYEYKEKI